MKLKKVLPLLDSLNKCKIFLAEDSEDEEPIFEGYISDVPWTLLNCQLYADASEDLSSISVWYMNGKKEGTIVPYFNIWITGET